MRGRSADLLGATALVLLISCANVANLSLARTFQRAREMSRPVGARCGPAPPGRQMVVESTLVGLAGGALGLIVAWSATGLLASFARLFTQRVVDPSIDLTVLGFTLVVSSSRACFSDSCPP